MEQYEHFKTANSGCRRQQDYKTFDPVTLSKTLKFDITVQGVQVCNQTRYRILQITETTGKRLKNEGGSAFMVRSYSSYMTVCPLVDHF